MRTLSSSTARAARLIFGQPGTPLALVTNTVDSTPRRIIAAPVSQTNPGTLLVNGTTRRGQTANETITIAASSTTVITSMLDHLTVTSILPGGGPWTAAITVGTANSTLVGNSAWLRLDDYGQAATQVRGTIIFAIEGSDDDPMRKPSPRPRPCRP